MEGTSKLCANSKCFKYSAVCPAGACRSCCVAQHSHWKYHSAPEEGASAIAVYTAPPATTYVQTYVPIEQETPPALGELSEQEAAEVLPIEGKTGIVATYTDSGGYWG